MTNTPSPAATETDARGLRELLAAATPGQWEVSGWDSGLSYRESNYSIITADLGDHVATVDYDGNAEGPHGAEGADAHLIAAAVNALPALLDELDAARERVRVVEGERDAARKDAEDWEKAAWDSLAPDHNCDHKTRAESAEAARDALVAGVEALAEEFTRRQARNATHNGGVSCSVWGIAGAEVKRIGGAS